MVKHSMKLGSVQFARIASGQKAIESRLYDEKRKQIRVGDEIEFRENENQENVLHAKVITLHYADSFQQLFVQFPVNDFGAETVEELLEEIYSFYTKEDEAAHGVVGIQVVLI